MATELHPFQVNRVEVFRSRVREGYGIGFLLHGRKDHELTLDTHRDKLHIDFHGNYWNALPPGASSLASWMLPLAVHHYESTMRPGSSEGQLSFILGAKGLAHSILCNTLEKLVRQGDPPIMVELLRDTDVFGQGVVLPSVLLREFNDPVRNNILSSIPPHQVSRRTNFFRSMCRTVRWLLFPVLFLFLCWSVLYYPPQASPLSPYAPYLFRGLVNSDLSVDFRSVTPLHPTKLSQAWEAGKVAGVIEISPPSSVPQLLEAAAALLGKESVSLAELQAVSAVLSDLEHSQGLVTRIMGFFTLVNTMWLLAIVGITVSIGPTIVILLRPLSGLFRRIARVLVERVVIPTARFLHEWGILEMGAWMCTVFVYLESIEIRSPVIGFYITLSALAMAGSSLSYSTILYGLHVVRSLSPRTRSHLANAFTAVATTPLAVYYDSMLLAFASVFSVYGILGFSSGCNGLCYWVGFRRDRMMRVAVASFLLLSAATAIKLTIGDPWWMEPFRMPIAIVGSLTLYLACLIYASMWSPYPTKTWLKRQIPMIFFLLLGQIVGNLILNHTGLANTATVFLVMFLVEKACDLHYHKHWNGWVLTFFLSCVGYLMALWLHAHPDNVSRMLDF